MNFSGLYTITRNFSSMTAIASIRSCATVASWQPTTKLFKVFMRRKNKNKKTLTFPPVTEKFAKIQYFSFLCPVYVFRHFPLLKSHNFRVLQITLIKKLLIKTKSHFLLEITFRLFKPYSHEMPKQTAIRTTKDTDTDNVVLMILCDNCSRNNLFLATAVQLYNFPLFPIQMTAFG